MANEPRREPYNIITDEELPIMLEKQLKGKEVSIGEEKGTVVFYSDIVTSSIGKETVAKISAIEYSVDRYNDQIALNNSKQELIVER